MVVKLYPHQEKAVTELQNGSILWGDVGTGKTITALAYFFSKVCGGVYGDLGSMRKPRDLFIITTAKKRDSLDWEADAVTLGIGKDREASVSGIQMTVDSWNNIGKYEEIKDAFFIFDEQRLVGSGAWTKSFIKIAKSNQWILLTATPGDVWMDYVPVFIAHGFYKNRTEFKHEHVIYKSYKKFPQIDRYVNEGRLIKYRNRLLVEMPYVRHTVRETTDVEVDFDSDLFDKVVKKRWHVYENRPLRDVAEMFSVMRKVVNSDTSRLAAVQTLMRTHPKLIVFYNFDYELEQLRKLKDECWDLSLEYPGQTYQVKELSPALLEMELASNASKNSTVDTSLEEVAEWTSHGHITALLEETTQGSPTNRSSATSVEQEVPTFQVAEWNGHKHEQIPTTDRWVYLVQYVAGSEGWNCIETDAIVFYSQTYSYKNFHQAHGRIDRLNTPFEILHYYNLVSKSLIDRAIAKSLGAKRNFNEADFGVGI